MSPEGIKPIDPDHYLESTWGSSPLRSSIGSTDTDRRDDVERFFFETAPAKTPRPPKQPKPSEIP